MRAAEDTLQIPQTLLGLHCNMYFFKPYRSEPSLLLQLAQGPSSYCFNMSEHCLNEVTHYRSGQRPA